MQGKVGQFALLLALSVAIWFGGYFRRGLWEPDEARYAYVAREMKWEGHMAVPHRYGLPYAHKPPLFFWLTNAAAHLTGGEINSFSARLPSFAGIVLALWMTWQIGALWFGRAVAWRAALILATSYLFWYEGNMGRMDSVLCGLETAALFLLFSHDVRPQRWRLMGAYVCMGFAVLAKGPVGFIVPYGAYICATASVGEWGRLRKWHLAWGPLVVMLFPAVWLLGAWREGAPGSYFDELFFKQNIGRMTGKDEFGKPGPFYYHLLRFPAEFLPWTLVLPAAWMALSADAEGRAARRRLLGWFLLVVGFFSVCKGKRDLYILAAYPAASLFVALAWERLEGLARRWIRPTVVLIVGFLALLGAGALGTALYPRLAAGGAGLSPLGRALSRIPPDVVKFLSANGMLFAVLGVILLAGAAGLLAVWRRRGVGREVFGALVATLVLMQIWVLAVVLPALDPLKTPEAIAPELASHVPPGQKILMLGEAEEIVPFYCGRLGVLARDPDDLRARMLAMKQGVVVLRLPFWEGVKAVLPGVKAVHPFEYGHKDLVWCVFDTQ